MKYYYVVVATPAGAVNSFLKADRHPLGVSALAQILQQAARVATQMAKGQLIPAESCFVSFLTELPEDAARERWPEDFQLTEKKGES